MKTVQGLGEILNRFPEIKEDPLLQAGFTSELTKVGNYIRYLKILESANRIDQQAMNLCTKVPIVKGMTHMDLVLSESIAVRNILLISLCARIGIRVDELPRLETEYFELCERFAPIT